MSSTQEPNSLNFVTEESIRYQWEGNQFAKSIIKELFIRQGQDYGKL